MTKPIPLPSRQVTAICKGAAKAGFVAEVKIGDVVVRLIPDDHSERKDNVDVKGHGYL